MRYLTRAWASGECSDAEGEAIEAAYRAHRAAVLPALPPALRAFAESVVVHDGLPRAVRLDRVGGTLRIALRCGNLRGGYADADLTYGGVRLDLLDAAVLRIVAEDPRAEALYDEVDVIDADAPGLYVHRWLWWPFRRELDVHFAHFAFTATPRADREFDPPAERYVEVSSPAV